MEINTKISNREMMNQIHLDKKYNFYIDKISDMVICDFIALMEILLRK